MNCIRGRLDKILTGNFHVYKKEFKRVRGNYLKQLIVKIKFMDKINVKIYIPSNIPTELLQKKI